MVAACRLRSSFFFSSRRRHTRLVSDWSSDVCSSDLLADADEADVAPGHVARQPREPRRRRARSEERRVGKECRSRGSRGYEKKRVEADNGYARNTEGGRAGDWRGVTASTLAARHYTE